MGWDDKKGRSGAWKIKNTWGKNWGEDGFMWIEYGSNNVGFGAFWVRSQSALYNLSDDSHARFEPALRTTPRSKSANGK